MELEQTDRQTDRLIRPSESPWARVGVISTASRRLQLDNSHRSPAPASRITSARADGDSDGLISRSRSPRLFTANESVESIATGGERRRRMPLDRRRCTCSCRRDGRPSASPAPFVVDALAVSAPASLTTDRSLLSNGVGDDAPVRVGVTVVRQTRRTDVAR